MTLYMLTLSLHFEWLYIKANHSLHLWCFEITQCHTNIYSSYSRSRKSNGLSKQPQDKRQLYPEYGV